MHVHRIQTPKGEITIAPFRKTMGGEDNGWRRRNSRQWLEIQANDNEEVTLKSGAILSPPDEDAIAPDAPEWPESHCPR